MCSKRKNKLHNLNNKQSTRNRALLRNYGIDFEQYTLMFNNQSGFCYICLTHRKNLSRDLAVDHNHQTGQIRALLCTNCNQALGRAKESIEILERMINYLKQFGVSNAKLP